MSETANAHIFQTDTDGFDPDKASDQLRQQARDQHLAGDAAAAIQTLTQAIQEDPGNPRVAMDMIQVLLDIGQAQSALELFEKLPNAATQSEMGECLNGQLTFARLASRTEGMDVLSQKLEENPEDAKARFDLSVCLIAAHAYDEAMSHLFVLQADDPDFEQGAPRELILTVINFLSPNNPKLAQKYRQKLNNLLN
jgi:putative thioredoxin